MLSGHGPEQAGKPISHARSPLLDAVQDGSEIEVDPGEVVAVQVVRTRILMRDESVSPTFNNARRPVRY